MCVLSTPMKVFVFSYRMANARAKAEQADQSALKAEQDSDSARLKAKEFAPEFHQPGKGTNSRLLLLF